MKKTLLAFGILFTLAFSAAKGLYNTNKKGVLIGGWDVVSYFNNKPVEGISSFKTTHFGTILYFANEENLTKFKNNPAKYFPQYGGWCAYAMGTDGSKVEIDPETYEIRNGKLYLFYNKLLTNTLELWLKEGPEKLAKNGDDYWQKLSDHK
ncbi:MAG: hypothetical protein KDC92_17120 [Bacteroidetes bacterium]|nr:hypothetical protein [Bacteroidota bacterium]